MNIRTVTLALIFLTVTSCATTQKPLFKQGPNEISIMTYNVENLFDTQHDEGKNDYAYLPLSLKSNPKHIAECNKMEVERYKNSCLKNDWSEQALQEKMKRLAATILQVNNGKGADLVILQEVENLAVLNRLNREHLQAASYTQAILIDGPDKRGIDIAFLSRLPLKSPAILHKINYKGKNKDDTKWMNLSRGILEATFSLPDGTPLTVFGVHLPSLRNPSYWRQQAIEHLNRLKAKVPKSHIIIAGGDLNISKTEDRKNRLYKKHLSKSWLVSHQIGCKDCKGTEYYHRNRQWSFLDALLFDKRLQGHESMWTVDSKSIAIANKNIFQTSRFFTPARFSATSPVGVSDHWPLYARLKVRTANKGVHKQ